MERRLSAILSADVVGYSRLMGANEVATLTALNERRSEILEPAIARHNGRVFKLTGDGLLAEFASVVSAVECATAIQGEMHLKNGDVPDDRRIDLRIGINLGDVIIQDGDIYGDGVNLAARIEGVAAPGRVAVSESVREHVGNRLDVRFEDRGNQQLKNIDHPVRVFEVVPKLAEQHRGPNNAGAPAEDKPSIAVLPFDNMSGDEEQEYFSNGITEDIITDLSKISGLFVVGRHTSFGYKGSSQKMSRIAAELGVRYLLEGSVRKAGNRVRITGQLIDGVTGGHVWAERYDRDLTDIFAIQDEITRTIVGQLKVRLVPAEIKAIGQAPTDNVEAYQLYLKGRQFFHNATKSFLRLARQMFVQATELDPKFARAYAGIANCDCRRVGWYGELIPEESILAIADQALALDANLAEAHAARADALSFFGHKDEAEAVFGKALELDPDSFDVNFLFARFYLRSGEPANSVPLYIRALELQPDDYQSPAMLEFILRGLGRIEESHLYGEMGVKRAMEVMRQYPESSRPAQLIAASLAGMGRGEEARPWLKRAIALDPDDSGTLYNAACTWAQLGDPEQALDALERWLPKAGVEKGMWLVNDCDFDPLRDDPRFQKILAAVAAPAGGP
jgi:adenylate cyclase